MPESATQEEIVEFICHPDDYGTIPEPQPSSDVLPEWYKMLPPEENGLGAADENFQGKSVRRCPAFLDSLNLGWILPFETDIKINTENSSGGDIEWDDGGEGVISEYDLGNGKFDDRVVETVQFHSSWAAKVPDGYSLLLLSPMNRRDQRLKVMGQVFDADQNLSTIDVPAFWLADNSQTIIREGDPMVQVIPFKRDTRLDEALLRPFRSDGYDAYNKSRKKSKVNRSWYRDNDWEPKTTRMLETNV